MKTRHRGKTKQLANHAEDPACRVPLRVINLNQKIFTQ
uniref:Uncharacterized protein n=1 Tax=Anguilla anguilla TaxID=7936 RepID=A0A0E9S4S4_ANGAN